MDKVYCYSGTDVLENRLDIRDGGRLLAAEIQLVSIRLYQLYEQPIPGNFDLKHLCSIHQHIFQDIYEWAGKLRTVNIAKKSLFCLVQHMQAYSMTIFPAYYNDCMRAKDSRDKFIHVFTSHYADLNALHPFREGNGRSQWEFARELCLECGYALDLRHTNHREIIAASIDSLDKGDNTGLEDIFRKCVIPLYSLT